MKYISQHDVVTHNLSKTKWDALWHSAIYFTSFFKKCWSWATKVISVTTCSLKNTVPRNQRMLCALLLESPQLLGLNGLFLKLVLATPSTLPLYFSTRGASLVAQWLRICLAMQRTQVPPLVLEDPTCCRVTEPTGHLFGCTLEPIPHTYWSWHALELVLCNERGHCNEKPMHFS